MTRVYNFGAGPAMFPEAVLQEAKAELLDWQGTGMSVMEISHRSVKAQALMEALEADLRELISIPSHYHVLFLGSAARTQFAMVPMNLLVHDQQAGYLVSGIWSWMAYEEAKKLKRAYVLASTREGGFIDFPSFLPETLKKDTTYVYYTPNETVNGVRFNHLPSVMGIPLVADMTSCLLSEPINVKDFGLIFAGAQKNIAMAGLSLVIIHTDLLRHINHQVMPTMLDYQTHVDHRSLYATPPLFNCYLALKMLKWIKAAGGVEALYQINCKKATTLYRYIDGSQFYHCPVVASARSIVNVCFLLRDASLEGAFLKAAYARGLCALQGHRTVGGFRASLYNAMPYAGVLALIDFMQDFALEHGR